jgi:hypothetical protein
VLPHPSVPHSFFHIHYGTKNIFPLILSGLISLCISLHNFNNVACCPYRSASVSFVSNTSQSNFINMIHNLDLLSNFLIYTKLLKIPPVHLVKLLHQNLTILHSIFLPYLPHQIHNSLYGTILLTLVVQRAYKMEAGIRLLL